MAIHTLIDTLRLIDSAVCQSVANKLAARFQAPLLSQPPSQSQIQSQPAHYDLHLRDAHLTYQHVQQIATAINTVHQAGGPSLQSFSLSYNRNVSDDGFIRWLEQLPSTVTEVGLVGCGLNDNSVDTLITWAATAPALHWLCVEHNNFSVAEKVKLLDVGKKTAGLLVVV